MRVQRAASCGCVFVQVQNGLFLLQDAATNAHADL